MTEMKSAKRLTHSCSRAQDLDDDDLQEEIEELQLKLRVTEAHRDDLLSVNSAKMEEIVGLEAVIDREKQYRQELNGKIRHANHMLQISEENLESANNRIDIHLKAIESAKANNNKLRDKLYDTENRLNDEMNKLEVSERSERALMKTRIQTNPLASLISL